MPTFLISLASKIGPYVGVALLALGLGFYGGYHWCLPQVLAAQLALANQQKADAQLTAKQNADVATFNAQLGVAQTAAQASVSQAVQSLATTSAAAEAAIATQAAQPGQDGPVAAVLQAENKTLLQEAK